MLLIVTAQIVHEAANGDRARAFEDSRARELLQAAEPVYLLTGGGKVAAKEMPPIGQLVDSRLGYFIRAGRHSMGADDWRAFLAFAEKHLSAGK